MPSTKDPSSGLTVLTKYTVLQDDVTTRDDFYPCMQSLTMHQMLLDQKMKEMPSAGTLQLATLIHRLSFLNYGRPLGNVDAVTDTNAADFCLTPAPYAYARRLCEFNRSIIESRADDERKYVRAHDHFDKTLLSLYYI